MTVDRVDPKLAPGVLAAAAWLMGRENECDVTLLQRAHLIGLLRKGRSGGPWKCDGPLLAHLLRQRARSDRLPKDGAVLVGIGEMIARARAPEDAIESILGRLFRHTYPETVRLRILRQALDLARPKKTVSRSLSSIYETEILSIMDWKQITFADQWIRHPEPLGASYGYGIGFVARVLLLNDPARLRWLAKEADKRRILPAIVGSIGEACLWSKSAAQKALRSGVPLFVGFGVAKLRDGGEDGKGWKTSDIDTALVASGTPIEGRIHLSAFMLKKAVHAWHRQKDRPAENRRRLAILKIDPHQAIGGEHNAVHQIARLLEDALELERWLAAVILALDDALQTAARLDIDPKRLWTVFEPSLVDTPEIRHRFAMAHTEGPLRQAALEEALTTFDRLAGARHPERISKENFDAVRAERELAFWAANSQVELSKLKKQSDAGHDAARRIGRVEAALRDFVLQPFAATRFHERFQNSIGRWSVVLQFALLVALYDRKAPLIRLRDEALKSASAFLPVAERFAYNTTWAEAVAGLVADAVSPMEGTVVQGWIDDERQPALLRAQLIWGCPAILCNDLQLATALIDKVATRKATRAAAGRNASHLLDIFDRAAVAMIREKRFDLYNYLAIPYNKAVAKADAVLAKSVSLQTLLAALSADAEARQNLLSSPVWGHSRLSEVI